MDKAMGEAVKIAVLIPYYQQKAGFLAAAVASVSAQALNVPAQVEIIIVDDGSPSAASAENFPALPAWCSLRIIEQENTGVGGARNSALNAVAADTTYIAFLDSDDIWLPGHLARAIAALHGGADFYFDQILFESHEASQKRIEDFCERAGKPLASDQSSYLIAADDLLEFCCSGLIPHLSQTVFKVDELAQVRFDETLRLAGEDRLFFFDVISRCKNVCCNVEIMGQRGRGVSIHRSRIHWDSGALALLRDKIRCRWLILQRFGLSPAGRSAIETDLRYLHDHFVFLAVRNVGSHPSIVWREIAAAVADQTGLMKRMPASLLRIGEHRRKLLAESDLAIEASHGT